MRAYGEIATIGFIGPPRTNGTVLHEAFRLAPPGVTWVWSTMGLRSSVNSNSTGRWMQPRPAPRNWPSRGQRHRDDGHPLISSKGAPYHEQLEDRLANAIGKRIPVTSDIHCVLSAFAALKLNRIAVASIYQRYIQDT